MELKLPAYGIIKELNNESLSKIYIKKYDMIVSFDSSTKVDGCKFIQLSVGDKISIHIIRKVDDSNKKYFMCDHIVITDVQAKWNNILKNDNKYSINHHLEMSSGEIRPEIIEPSAYSIKSVTVNKRISAMDKKIIDLYNQGKSLRFISSKVPVHYSTVRRIVKHYRENKED